MEEKLAAYREARENAKPTSLGNGVTMGGSVSEEEYGISYDASILSTFDSREMAEAYGTAISYVEDTLGISPETRDTVYHCVDPRIWAIYEAEDKGVHICLIKTGIKVLYKILNIRFVHNPFQIFC